MTMAASPAGTTAAVLLFLMFMVMAPARSTASTTRNYNFEIKKKSVTRLCKTKNILTVNGQFPGPTIFAREDDRVVVNVVNHAQYNLSIHWHGVRQLRSAWADGPAYITQCPIMTGQSYVYEFMVAGQRGTLWWHAHVSWLRATIYGPIVILPKLHIPYPFPMPHSEITILFGEWFNADTEAVIAQALQTGGGPNVSDAYTINGFPGPLYRCSSSGGGRLFAEPGFKMMVKPGKTYLLRLINAALNDDLFFGIDGHDLTVVEVDAIYVKPFSTPVVLITPGQTTNVLLHTKPYLPAGAASSFLMAARPYATGLGTFDNTTTSGTLEYETAASGDIGSAPYSTSSSSSGGGLTTPWLPAMNDTAFAFGYGRKLKSLATAEYPANVPKSVDRRFLFTIGLGTSPCPKNQTCQGPTNTTKFAAAVNNVSFVLPTTAILQSYFAGKSAGVFGTDFPANPPFVFNYTGTPPNNTMVARGTETVVLEFNTAVEVVLQDTSILGVESHPLHLHGFNFFVVGQGFGNYDPAVDLKGDPAFNLVDPVERNTIGVPSGGWVALRFLADNPGVWFMHCHYEAHVSWGLKMVWVVLDGEEPNQKLLPPPYDLPKC